MNGNILIHLLEDLVESGSSKKHIISEICTIQKKTSSQNFLREYRNENRVNSLCKRQPTQVANKECQDLSLPKIYSDDSGCSKISWVG